ncbi:hypothetical protein SALBM217S_10860 [Streptomyces griseoloalbus]
MRRPVRRVGRIDTHMSRAPPGHGSVCARRTSPRTASGSVTTLAGPTASTLQPRLIASSTWSTSKATSVPTAAAGTESGAVRKTIASSTIVVVDRDDRGAAVGRRHGDASHTMRGEQAAAFLRAEVPQPWMQQCVALTGRQVDARPAQGRDGGVQRGGQA